METDTNRRSVTDVAGMPGLPVAVTGPVLPVVLTTVLATGAVVTGLVADVGQLAAYALYGVAGVLA
jgi:hypothetical protein